MQLFIVHTDISEGQKTTFMQVSISSGAEVGVSSCIQQPSKTPDI